MRRDFIKQAIEEMEGNDQIYFLTGDLGFNALEEIKRRFPERFINVGIAEQNLIGMAAGLALEGKRVIAYSIASFVSLRPYEQIRTDVCYHNLDVKIVGTGGGVNYATHGVTHHTIEDLAIMNVLPNMQVLSPGYSWEAVEATKSILQNPGPAYIRLGKSPGKDFSAADFRFRSGKGHVLRDGKDIVFIATGNVLDIVMDAAAKIEKELRLSVCVVSTPWIKPFDESLIVEKVKKAKGIFTVEEHSIIGGLGSIVAEVLWRNGVPKRRFHMFGFPDAFMKQVGGRDYLLARVDIEKNALVRRVRKIMTRP